MVEDPSLKDRDADTSGHPSLGGQFLCQPQTLSTEILRCDLKPPFSEMNRIATTALGKAQRLTGRNFASP